MKKIFGPGPVILLILLSACLFGAAVIASEPSGAARSKVLVPGANLPLSFEQRQARDAYLFNRRGLQFGVPKGGERPAVIEMQAHRNEARTRRLNAISGD